MEPIEGISNEIKSQMKTINDLIPTVSDNLIFPKEDDNPISKYIYSLEQNANEFLDNIQKIKKAESYYIDFENNINKLIKCIKEWLEKRKEEKKMLLGTIRGNVPKYDPNQVTNPFDNGNNNKNADYYKVNNINNNNFNLNPNIPKQNIPTNPNINQNNAQFYGNNNTQNNNYYNQNPNLPNTEYFSGYSNTPAKNYIPPARFNQNNNFDDHFNPNKPNNVNNYNPNYNGQYNNNIPYNNNRGF